MMQQMFGKAGQGELSPAAMCQAMMTSVGKAAEMAAYATPEVRTMFEEWARSVEDEVLATLKARAPLDLAALAGALKISPESALLFLGKLVREGKANIAPYEPRSDRRRAFRGRTPQAGHAIEVHRGHERAAEAVRRREGRRRDPRKPCTILPATSD